MHRLFSFTLLILLRLTFGRPCMVYILDSVEDAVCVACLDREVVGLVLRRLANVSLPGLFEPCLPLAWSSGLSNPVFWVNVLSTVNI